MVAGKLKITSPSEEFFLTTEPHDHAQNSSDRPMALWGGRFSGGPSDALAALSVSTQFDWRLARHDIAGSRAHAGVLHTAGLLDDEQYQGMIEALDKLEDDVVSGRFVAGPDDEDVHTALERGLMERAGDDLGGRLRAGRSRNDQIIALLRRYLREEARSLAGEVLELVNVLARRAEEAGDAVIAGRTHMQDRKSTRLNSSHSGESRMPSSA